MKETQAFNFYCADVKAGGKYLCYAYACGIPRALNWIFSRADRDLISHHMVDYIGFSYYLSSTTNKIDPDGVYAKSILLGGARHPFLVVSE